ncbi:hypothetical protein AJ78_01176 [Emergomyces pasteurianus Ep9510]|uniref:Uncharacterized protein n=1 Tax=Emergomyces pasteurianus Ep9510 TaxID=1447872 RepID=A0A1J9QF82_9EURO|nr:hypothetical protein AJ78_01176 [Emergomyces pasteurianus Ep9510]
MQFLVDLSQGCNGGIAEPLATFKLGRINFVGQDRPLESLETQFPFPVDNVNISPKLACEAEAKNGNRQTAFSADSLLTT